MMNRETIYDDVYDAQRHFRSILDAMARPGKINRLGHVALDTPPALNRGAAYVGFALLNGDVTFHLAGFGRAEEDYLRANTACRPAPVDQADFLFLFGTGSSEAILSAKVGLPAYPDTGATAVIQVGQIGRSSATGGVQLVLTGPGIEKEEIVFVTGLRVEHLEALRARNTEFPLGVDAILVASDDCIVCLPRTTKVVWNVL
jgi:alpha-D-ribose 1-methylphosphonate 5-triphosphate synthase subunit PhnH